MIRSALPSAMPSKDSHYDAYDARFVKRFGDKAPGTYVKFGSFLIARLTPADFTIRFQDYNELHLQCVEMLREGATLNDTSGNGISGVYQGGTQSQPATPPSS